MICSLGIVGNVLNLLVLTRKSLSTRMDRMEKSAHVGLIALAISDLLFCVTAFPHSLQDRKAFEHEHIGFWLLYEVYGNAVINIFIMSSTWLTVAMAVSRYLAVCYPMKGREILGATFSRCANVVVFVFCILFNLPRFWSFQIESVECEGGWLSYYTGSGPLQQSELAETVYMWLYFMFCILIPLVALVYCNMYLIRALKVSASMRREHARGRDTASDNKNIVTLTLIIIIVLYIFLVVPTELLTFAKGHVTSSLHFVSSDRYNLAVACCNTLQAMNFACNFVLYCIINVHYRRSMKELFLCKPAKRQISRWSTRYEFSSRWSTRYDSVTATTLDNRDHVNSFPVACTRV